MTLTRKDAVDIVVELLQPATIPKSELTNLINSDFEVKASDDLFALSAGIGRRPDGRSTKAAIQNGGAFISAAQLLVRRFEELSAEYQRDIIPLLKKSQCNNRADFIKNINDLIDAVAIRKVALAPRRSGGGTEKRDEKSRKQVCAIFALSLISRYHANKITRGSKCYHEITSALAEHFEGLPNADTRRACEEMFIEIHGQEHEDE